MTVLSYTNAFLGIQYPQHGSGKTKVQSYLFPGAVQPKPAGLTVTSYTQAFLGIPYPQHGSGKTAVQGFIYPGALQPQPPPAFILMPQIVT